MVSHLIPAWQKVNHALQSLVMAVHPQADLTEVEFEGEEKMVISLKWYERGDYDYTYDELRCPRILLDEPIEVQKEFIRQQKEEEQRQTEARRLCEAEEFRLHKEEKDRREYERLSQIRIGGQMILATFETPHFTFHALAENELQARQLLERAWEKHVDETGADIAYFDAQQDGNYIEIALGEVVRDDEPFYKAD
jgi:hypothetical protein